MRGHRPEEKQPPESCSARWLPLRDEDILSMARNSSKTGHDRGDDVAQTGIRSKVLRRLTMRLTNHPRIAINIVSIRSPEDSVAQRHRAECT